jgi:polyisoprenoid-binding protein YceI
MSWKIDPTHTQIEFTVKHMMIAKVRGRFETFEGSVELDPENPIAARVEGTIEATSLNTRDEQRDGHLRSADFFDVEKYPTMKFRSSRIESAAKGQYKVYGDLTIKNITREVVFEVTDEGQAQDPWGNERRGYSAVTKINRKDFGLTWNVALETGGWLVGDEVTVSAEVELVQVQPQPEFEPELALA